MNADPFVDYYEKQSASPATVQHFLRLRSLLLGALENNAAGRAARVADIGCGAGTFSRIWADAKCEVGALDVNGPLVEIARQRAQADGIAIDFRVGSADALPWPDAHFDIVVMPELLEHVENWHGCLAEAARVLRPGGIVYLSTTNRLCPIQQEFTLPGYSWYPGWVKQRCLRLARTTHREWVNHAVYPAVNWFDPYSLGAALRRLGVAPLDRFELLARYSDGKKRLVGSVLSRIPPLAFLGHVATAGTIVLGRKV